MVDGQRRPRWTAAARSCRRPRCRRSARAGRRRRGRGVSGPSAVVPMGNGRASPLGRRHCSMIASRRTAAGCRGRRAAGPCGGWTWPARPSRRRGSAPASASPGRRCRRGPARSRPAGRRSRDRSPTACPRVTCPTARAARMKRAWRGISAAASASQMTLMPLSGPRSRRSATAAGSGSRRPSTIASTHGQCVRFEREWSRWLASARRSAISSNRPTRSSASAVEWATWSPASGEVTERRWGSHFNEAANGRSTPRAATIVRSSGLCRQDAWRTRAAATPDTTSSAPWTPSTPESARSTVIGTPSTRRLPAAASSRELPQLVVATVLERARRRSWRRSRGRRAAAAGRGRRDRAPTGRRCAARPVGPVRRRRGRRGGARCAPASTSSVSSSWRRSTAALNSACWRRNFRLPLRRSSIQLATTTSGDIRVRARNCGWPEKANIVRPAPSGATAVRIWKRRGSDRSGTRPMSAAVRSATTGGRYGVRWNSIWPSWSMRSPGARTNGRKASRVAPIETMSSGPTTRASVMTSPLQRTGFSTSSAGATVTVQSAATTTSRWWRETVGSVRATRERGRGRRRRRPAAG